MTLCVSFRGQYNSNWLGDKFALGPVCSADASWENYISHQEDNRLTSPVDPGQTWELKTAVGKYYVRQLPYIISTEKLHTDPCACTVLSLEVFHRNVDIQCQNSDLFSSCFYFTIFLLTQRSHFSLFLLASQTVTTYFFPSSLSHESCFLLL